MFVGCLKKRFLPSVLWDFQVPASFLGLATTVPYIDKIIQNLEISLPTCPLTCFCDEASNWISPRGGCNHTDTLPVEQYQLSLGQSLMQHLFKSRPAKPWEHQVPVWILTQNRCVRNWRLEPIFRGTSSYQAISRIKARAEAKQPLHPELELKSGPESDPRLWSRIIKTRAWEDGLAGKNACSTFMRVSFFKMQIASFPSIIYQRSCPFFMSIFWHFGQRSSGCGCVDLYLDPPFCWCFSR